MKKLAAMLCLSAMATGAFAQGLVIFNNSPATLISTQTGTTVSTMSGPSGSFYFGLLTGTAAAGPFAFGGIYATNVGTANGRFIGGTQAVNGWAPGTTMFYEIAGWASSLGATFNPAWLTTPPNGFFGISGVGSGVAGGGPQSLPPLPVFGGTSGIQSGFTLSQVPEPTSMALAGLGAAALLIFRRRK